MMTVLADARRVATHHGHHAADAAGGDGVDQRPVSGAEPPAEVVRQGLVGEAGHQGHAGARAGAVGAGGAAAARAAGAGGGGGGVFWGGRPGPGGGGGGGGWGGGRVG